MNKTKKIILIVVGVIAALIAILAVVIWMASSGIIGDAMDSTADKSDCINNGGYIDKDGNCRYGLNDPTDDSEDENNTTDKVELFVGDENISFLSEESQKLYKKYIKYYHDSGYDWNDEIIPAIETSNYKNINVNDSSSDAYLIKYAIYNILSDNKINIKNYSFDMCVDCDSEQEYKNGYKITTSQIETYIKNNFKVNRTIDFKNAKLYFTCNSHISYHYYEKEGYYRLVDATSIPASGCGDDRTYSKVVKEEISGDDLIIYTQYMIYGNYDGSVFFVNSSVDEMSSYEYSPETEDYIEKCGNEPDECFGNCRYNHYKSCILNNYSDKIGQFKHTFTKDSDGNYYWVSSQKIN